MAFDSRLDSGFKDLCVEREKVQSRQERGEGKKIGERRRKQARKRHLERKEKKCERATRPGRVLKSDHSSSLGLSVGKGGGASPAHQGPVCGCETLPEPGFGQVSPG